MSSYASHSSYDAATCDHSFFPLLLMVVVLERPTAEIDFQGRHANEEIRLYYHQHWIRLVWPTAKMCIKTALLFASAYITLVFVGFEEPFSRRLMLTLFSIFFLLVQFEYLFCIYRYFLYVIVVTDKKVHRIKKTLLTTDDHISVDLWMLQDINRCQHSIVQNLLGFGTIELEAQETVLRLHFTPHVARMYESIMHLRELAREKMTYHGGRVRPGKQWGERRVVQPVT